MSYFSFAAMEEMIQYINQQLISVNWKALQSSFNGKVCEVANAFNIINGGILFFDQLLNTWSFPFHNVGCVKHESDCFGGIQVCLESDVFRASKTFRALPVLRTAMSENRVQTFPFSESRTYARMMHEYCFVIWLVHHNWEWIAHTDQYFVVVVWG